MSKNIFYTKNADENEQCYSDRHIHQFIFDMRTWSQYSQQSVVNKRIAKENSSFI
jgi:hypothetical protein